MPDETRSPRLTANGADIPLIGLGTLFLRDAECVRATETALSLGYRHIDTAVMYGNEVEVGDAIRSSGVPRSELFITTKVLPEEIGEGDLQRSAAGSLQRLGLDYVDLLLIHHPNSAIPLSISVTALCDAKKLALTRHIGVSNFPTELLEAAAVLAADHGECLVANQCEYHPRVNQTKLLEACRANGIAFVSHTPLGHGRLLDDPTLVTIARRVGKTPAQVLLRWNIQQPGIVTIPKSAQPARLAENLQVFNFELSDEDMNDLFRMACTDGPVNTPVPKCDRPIGVTAAAGGEQEIGKDGFVENFVERDLERFVKDEAFHFGDNATEWYFEPAEVSMDAQWQSVKSFLDKHQIDYTNTMELSCGHGRNSERLSTLAKNLVLVDVVPENILFCKNRFSGKPWRFVINNGFDLREIASNSITFVYCLEAAVHFDIEIILSYIKEFRRVLAPGACGFVHHSNVTANPGKDWRTIPHGRNFMSKEIFAHLCIHNGLEILDQYVFDQGGPGADCFSLFRKKGHL
jgi:diketogulonate reductase-like aldo/keto reductase